MCLQGLEATQDTRTLLKFEKEQGSPQDLHLPFSNAWLVVAEQGVGDGPFPSTPLLHPGREHHPFCLWEYGNTQSKSPLQTGACWPFEVSLQAFSMQYLSLGHELGKHRDGIEARGPGKGRRKCHCFHLVGSPGHQHNVPVWSASDGLPVPWGPILNHVGSN